MSMKLQAQVNELVQGVRELLVASAVYEQRIKVLETEIVALKTMAHSHQITPQQTTQGRRNG